MYKTEISEITSAGTSQGKNLDVVRQVAQPHKFAGASKDIAPSLILGEDHRDPATREAVLASFDTFKQAGYKHLFLEVQKDAPFGYAVTDNISKGNQVHEDATIQEVIDKAAQLHETSDPDSSAFLKNIEENSSIWTTHGSEKSRQLLGKLAVKAIQEELKVNMIDYDKSSSKSSSRNENPQQRIKNFDQIVVQALKNNRTSAIAIVGDAHVNGIVQQSDQNVIGIRKDAVKSTLTEENIYNHFSE